MFKNGHLRFIQALTEPDLQASSSQTIHQIETYDKLGYIFWSLAQLSFSWPHLTTFHLRYQIVPCVCIILTTTGTTRYSVNRVGFIHEKCVRL